MKKIKFIDLFCGIGGFHYAIEDAAERLGFEAECVFASDIDKDASKAYKENFGIDSHCDITKVDATDIPKHDILLAGFPCQAFSYAGKRMGFEDTRGTLFFEFARILKEVQPKVFICENVKGITMGEASNLLGSEQINIFGEEKNTIFHTLIDCGYNVRYKVLNAKNFLVPQSRERTIFIGVRKDIKKQNTTTTPPPPKLLCVRRENTRKMTQKVSTSCGKTKCM
jgi:DNA (cytosine-5)-methyltransferase 1